MTVIKSSDAIDPSHFSGEQVIHGAGEFMARAKPPEFILEKVIQRGQIYTLTAKWGHGKTALGLAMAMHIAAGIDFAGFRVKRSRVLYLAGENPFDVQMRSIALCREMEVTASMLDGWLYFSDKAFPINDKEIKDAFVREVKKVSDVDLVFVDTGPAHTEIEEENSNGKMHKVAVSMREMAGDLNNSALLTFMHPTQGATRDTLRSRGGGAYAGQVDGELLAWQDPITKQIEFWHSTKFRGSGFDSVFFDLKRVDLDGFDDNFGNKAVSVIAIHANRVIDTNSDEIGGDTRTVFDVFVSCAKSKTLVTDREWRRESYEAFADRSQPAKKEAYRRAKKSLLSSKMVIDSEIHSSFRLPNATFANVAVEEADQ
jgi:hypothetical protein